MLFRPEVLEYNATSWIGGLRVARSLPTWIITSLAVLLAVSLIAYGVFGSYARKARVAGILVSQGGELNVTAPSLGRVIDIRVREGQAVKAGEALMTLDTDRTIESRQGTREATALIGEQIENRRRALDSRRQSRESGARLEKQAINARVRSLDVEIGKIEDEIELQKRRRDIAAASLQRHQQLAANRFVSSAQVEQHQEALIDQEASLKSLERSLASARKDREASAMDLRQVDVQLAAEIATLKRDLASLNQEGAENAIRRSTVITASRPGTVSAIAVSPGQSVGAGQSLAAIQPASSRLEAHLWAPTRTAGFVKEGQQVLVRYAAFPYQKFGVHRGSVSTISRSAFALNELPPSLQTLFGRQSTPEALYRVTVSLQEQEMAAFDQVYQLRPGMALEADIVQERRSIIEWLFEPLFAFARRA